MHKNSTPEIQTSVLTKIGRNVLNLQKMEGMIKYLVAVSRIEGPIDELAQSFEKTRDALSKRSMGLAAGDLFGTLLGRSPEQPQEGSNENWASLSFQIGLDPDARQAFESALRSLIEERNQLIHSMFLRFDLTSLDECEAMMDALDRQHESIKTQHQRMQTLLAHVASTSKIALAQIAKYIEKYGNDA